LADFYKSAIDFLKLAPRYLFVVAAACAVVLWGPENFLKRLRLFELTEHYGPWIGGLFLLSSIAWVANTAIKTYWWLAVKFRQWKLKSQCVEHLHALTEDEKKILRFYISQHTKTNYLGINDGVVSGLEAKGIIHRASTIGVPGLGFTFAYNISEFASKYINENNGVLTGTTNFFRTDRDERFPY
jgi:hypothetical protein